MLLTTNTGAYELLDDEMKNSEIAYPSDEVLEDTEVFLNLDEETNKKIDALWTEIISSSNEQVAVSNGGSSADAQSSSSIPWVLDPCWCGSCCRCRVFGNPA